MVTENRDPIDPMDEWIGDGLADYGGAEDELADFDPLFAGVARHDARSFFQWGNPATLDRFEEDRPTLMKRTDGQALLYTGTVNLIAGEPGSGKSWLAQYEATRLANAGAHVLMLDYESTYRSVMGRLAALGLHRDARARIHYPEGLGRLSAGGVEKLADYARMLDVDLIIFDGVAEALAAHGLSEDKAAEYAAWHHHVPRALSRGAGAAVLLLDHVPKPAQSRAARGEGREPDLYPRGSGHKLAAIDGAAYMLTSIEPLSREHPGTSDLTIAKDREGFVGPKRWKAARVELTPADHGRELDVEIRPPAFNGRPPTTLASAPGSSSSAGPLTDDFVRDVLDAVTAAARRSGPLGTRAVADELRARDVRFSDKLVTPALIRLETRGDVITTKGPRGGKLYAPKPMQEAIDLIANELDASERRERGD